MNVGESLFAALPDPIVDGGCDGSRACRALVHIHGCFADNGNCDDVDEHQRVEYAWCWIACPHDPPCLGAAPSSDPRDE